MRWKEGEYWLRDAVKYIKFPPDRRKVQEELYEHMISRNLEFLAAGASEEEADALVCRAMGDPEEVGKALAEVHRPFWGYFLRALRILLGLVVVLGIVVMLVSWNEWYPVNFSHYRSSLAIYEGRITQWVGQTAAEKCGDYRFRLRRAAVAAPGEGEQGQALVLELRASTWDPVLGMPDYGFMTRSLEDSLGNRYEAYPGASRDCIFFSDQLLYVPQIDPEAEWAVLVLASGDRELRFPVKLREGGP